MWMMGYSDAGEIQDPFSGRKLRPLMPRPAITPPCFTRIHGADFLTLNHHLAAMAEQNKRDLGTQQQQQQVVVSSRWNPTPEQLQTLEELYRRGTRTPSAEQIQHITAQLRRYGKIEGKNVFYWFQNHKARERQKRRRQLDDEKREPTTTTAAAAAAGGNRTAFEVEQTKNWASPTNSSTLPEKGEAECKGADGWVQFDDDDDAEPQIRRRNATWRGMNLSCSSCPPTTVTSALPSMKPQDFLNIFLEPYTRGNLDNSAAGEEEEAAQTLQLFPLRSSDGDEEESAGAAMNNASADHVTPFQFFEFLPLKN